MELVRPTCYAYSDKFVLFKSIYLDFLDNNSLNHLLT